MGYFRELPNVQYENFIDNKDSQSYILMKNIFLRGKLRDDLQNVFTVFNKYTITEDERADQIAEKLYGDPTLDWVVIVTANIINYQNEFPLTERQLWDYVANKYGEENINDFCEFVTTEVRDSENRLILPANLVVDSDFTIPNPDIPGAILNPVTGITNFEKERSINDQKKTIYVLKQEYLNIFLEDMEDLARYGFNSEFIDEKTIKTTNSKNKNP